MRLLIIRHADPDYENDSLTKKGWKEAELLADRLAALPISDFYVSTLGRIPLRKKDGKRQSTYPRCCANRTSPASMFLLTAERGTLPP